jgi:eukaryotic-like serine/threonine-protein kinase
VIGSTIGHYEIHAKIGEGGMGTVYRAHDQVLQREVAIKLLTKNVANLIGNDRLLAEARIAGAAEMAVIFHIPGPLQGLTKVAAPGS